MDGADLSVGCEDAHRQLCQGWGQEWKRVMLISTTTASLLAGSKDICPPWPCQPAKTPMELRVQVPEAAWVGLPLWIPQLKEANTLLLTLGKKDETLLGHQVYAFSFRSCSFIKPMVEPVPGSGKVIGYSGHSDPSPLEKSSQFPCSLLLPPGCLLANHLFMLGYRPGSRQNLYCSHKNNKNCSQGDLLPGM